MQTPHVTTMTLALFVWRRSSIFQAHFDSIIAPLHIPDHFFVEIKAPLICYSVFATAFSRAPPLSKE
jgi:hypothetical protein